MKKVLLFSFIALSTLLWNCKHDSVDPEVDAYQLDEKTSIAIWKGSLKTGYFNEGAISITSDLLTVQNGKVTGGSFTIPLATLVNYNLPDTLKDVLIHHLQSVDFFNMAMSPNLTYTITSITSYTGSEGMTGANFQVNGNLTILGKTNPVNFPARIQVSNNQLSVEATLKVDRTKWGVNYASDPTLPDEGYILPDVDIHLKLAGTKQ